MKEEEKKTKENSEKNDQKKTKESLEEHTQRMLEEIPCYPGRTWSF